MFNMSTIQFYNLAQTNILAAFFTLNWCQIPSRCTKRPYKFQITSRMSKLRVYRKQIRSEKENTLGGPKR